MTPSKIAYLLCELKSRDFEARLLVASHLLRDGCAVVVGQRWGVGHNRQFIPRGCYLFPTANNIQAAGMEQVREAGHAVVVEDNEAMALVGPASLVALSPDATTHDLLLAFNEKHAAAIAGRFPAAKTRVVGNPRLDLIRRLSGPADAPEAQYLLFNTNFPLTNSLWGPGEAAFAPLRQAGMTDIEERFEFEQARRAALLPVIEWAAKAMGIATVVRPHPGEGADFWHAFAALHPNIRIVIGESPTSWIRGAVLICHADCTTGLEAALMGKPALNVSTHEWGAKFVMREVNVTAHSTSEAIAVLERFRDSGHFPLPPKRASDLFPAHGGKKTAKAVLDVLRKKGAKERPAILNWQPITRSETQVKKFSASLEEVVVNADIAAAGAKVTQLDDSTFLLVPRS